MITLVALFRFIAMERKSHKPKERNNNETINSLQTKPNPTTPRRTRAGPSLIPVIQGALTVYKDDCTFTTYSAGQSFTDLGCGDIHNVVNETGMEAKDVAVQIVPHGAPRRDDKPNPGCAQPTPCPAFCERLRSERR